MSLCLGFFAMLASLFYLLGVLHRACCTRVSKLNQSCHQSILMLHALIQKQSC